MKRRDLLRHLEAHGCEKLREGGDHTMYANRAVKKVVESKPRPSNGQYKVSLTQLRKLMLSVPPEQRLPRKQD